MNEEKNEEKLVKTKIKGRIETYFLVTENDLNNFKQNNIFGDLFFLLSSIFIGNYLVKANNLLLLLGILFLILSFFYYYIKFSTINKIKKSGEIKSLPTGKEKDDNLLVIEAKYGSSIKNKDITDKLNKLIKDGKLLTIVNNNLTDGDDPHRGIPKTLKIKYRHNGLIIEKEFQENEPIRLP